MEDWLHVLDIAGDSVVMISVKNKFLHWETFFLYPMEMLSESLPAVINVLSHTQ